MSDNTERVVKCGNEQCGLHYGYSEAQTACPFCHTEHGKAEEKIIIEPKKKKLTVKTQKESFKMWKGN